MIYINDLGSVMHCQYIPSNNSKPYSPVLFCQQRLVEVRNNCTIGPCGMS